MNVALRKAWTQQEFFDWAQAQEGRYEFDGLRPVAMTGGTVNHSRIIRNLNFALRTRLRGGACEPLGPDAGIQTWQDTVRYPDVLVTCSKPAGNVRIIAEAVAVFEVLSPSSERTDRIIKVREYAAVPSIRRYVILESTSIGLTVMTRDGAEEPWRVSVLTEGEILHLPEIGIEIPLSEIYEDIVFAEAPEAEISR